MDSTSDFMNNYSSYHIIIFISLLLSFLFPQKTVNAQNQNFVEIPLESFHDEKPVELLGLISSQSLNIPIPEGWSIGEENWMEIDINSSPLLDLSRSSLTILLNGFQITSYTPTNIPETKQIIPIPGNMFSQGNNILTFTGALYLPHDRDTNCQNWDDPSRWLTIEPGGILHLSFVKRDLLFDLSKFPQTFIEPLENYIPDKKATLIVMPENSTDDDLTSLSTISYLLGSSPETNYDWHPEIVTEDQFTPNKSVDRNIIFISNTPQQLQDIANNNKDYIALLPSPWSQGFAVMLISDQDRQDGISPASVFSSPARSILLHGNVAYVDDHPLPIPRPFQNEYSFDDLGYLDRTVKGIGDQSLIYSLYVPYDIDPVLTKLNLGLVHSPDLDVQNSSFTVYLNGFSVAGILPTARSSTAEPITISLPAQRFRPGLNFIRINFDLHIPYSSCDRAPESVWATVLSSTTIETTYRNRSPIPSLNHFPLPFNQYPGFIFVIPDHFDQNDLGNISRLSFVIGMASPQLKYPPSVMIESDFMQVKTEHSNVILVGLPTQNSAIRDVNDLLPQPFNEDGYSLQEEFGVYLPSPDAEASLGLIQIIPSPWVSGGTVMVMTGNDQQGLGWVYDVILNPASWDQYSGNLMVVGYASQSEAYGESPSVVFQQTADASNIPIIGPILQRLGHSFLTLSLIAIGTALLLVVCILWVMRTMRIRNAQYATEMLDEREEHEQEDV
jgi:hypothetical protein